MSLAAQPQDGGVVRLRDVQLSDVDAYVRMRCDPVMMAELGGPVPREGIEDKVRRGVDQAAADVAWIKMILPDDDSSEVAGSVVLWPHEANDGAISEIGWMVLPAFQGQGLGKHAVRVLLEAARDDGRWGLVHAFPAVTNTASNGICRSAGFRLERQEDATFAGLVFRTNHWIIDPQADLVIPCASP
jgi:RimJ/RimL family protein N-acetyltransferase